MLDRGDAGVVGAKKRDLARLVADGQRGVADAVVAGDGQTRRDAGLQQAGHVGLKRQKPAGMLGHQAAVQPDFGLVGDGAEAQHGALAGAQGRQRDHALVERPAVVVAQGFVLALVVVAGGHRHQTRAGQRRGGVDVMGGKIVAEAEIPKAALRGAQAGRILLRIQHSFTCFCVFTSKAANLWSGGSALPCRSSRPSSCTRRRPRACRCCRGSFCCRCRAGSARRRACGR